MQASKLPAELSFVQPEALEGYVRGRCLTAIQAFTAHLDLQVPLEDVLTAAEAASKATPLLEPDFLDVDKRQLRLVLWHDCRYVGCQLTECSICQHSRQRKCVSHINPKGYVDAELKSKCNNDVRVEVIDEATGMSLREDIPDVCLEMAIIDGPLYDSCVLDMSDGAELSLSDLQAMMLLSTARAKPGPLLVPGEDSAAVQAEDYRVVVPLKKGVALLPELKLKASSEAVIKGKRPAFRLLVYAVDALGQPVAITPVVSDGFVITTRRAKCDAKAEIPIYDDNVKVVENIGKETVKKLADLRAAGVRHPVPDNVVENVGQLRNLILLAEEKPGLQASLQKELGLKKDQWETVKEHLSKAVDIKLVLRTWFPSPTASHGLLFNNEDGKQDPFKPLDLLHRTEAEGLSRVVRVARHGVEPAQRKEVLRVMVALRQQAEAAWWVEGHPGWACTPCVSENEPPVLNTFTGEYPAASTGKRHREISRTLTHHLRSQEQPRKRRTSRDMDVDLDQEASAQAAQVVSKFQQGRVRSSAQSGLRPRTALDSHRSDQYAARLSDRSHADELVRVRSNSMPPNFNFGDMPGKQLAQPTPAHVTVSAVPSPRLENAEQRQTPSSSGGSLPPPSPGHPRPSAGAVRVRPGGSGSLLGRPASAQSLDLGEQLPSFSDLQMPSVSMAFLDALSFRGQSTASRSADQPDSAFWETQIAIQGGNPWQAASHLPQFGTPAAATQPTSQAFSDWNVLQPPGQVEQQLPPNAFQSLILDPVGTPPSAFAAGPTPPHSIGQDASEREAFPQTRPPGESGMQLSSLPATSGPPPDSAFLAPPQEGRPGAGPAEDAEVPRSMADIQMCLSELLQFPSDWQELATRLCSRGVGSPRGSEQQEMDALVSGLRRLSSSGKEFPDLGEPLISLMNGSRPLGSRSLLSLPLDSATLDGLQLEGPFPLTLDLSPHDLEGHPQGSGKNQTHSGTGSL